MGMRRIEQGFRPGLVAEAVAPEPDAGPSEDVLAAGIDDATAGYVLRAQVPFDLLRQAAGQLAGLLVLAAAGGSSAQDHPMLGLSSGCVAEALDALRGITPPGAAAHHHHHLLRAAASIGTALGNARERLHQRDDASVEAILAPLRAGFRHLQWAASALPGFEIVAFGQGCCAAHPAVARPPGGARRSPM
jgi:hypothetical protein